MKKLALLFLLFLAAIVFLADRGLATSFFALVHAVPGADKLGHFLLMGTLSFLVNMGLEARQWPVAGRQVLRGSLLVALLVTAEELTQLLLPTRSFSLLDLLSDYVGIWLFGRLAAYLVNRRRPVSSLPHEA